MFRTLEFFLGRLVAEGEVGTSLYSSIWNMEDSLYFAGHCDYDSHSHLFVKAIGDIS